MARPIKVVIMGAGGRDFHNFNVYFRNNPNFRVVAFTAAQIPGISGRRYPPKLAGELYPEGIPILPEEALPDIIKKYGVDLVVLSYSDLDYVSVGKKLTTVLSAGASFMVLGPKDTMLRSIKPVIAVTATRTGSGKSSVSRKIAEAIRRRGLKVVPVRHPMGYGDLERMAVQRFETLEDLDKYGVTLEEREEYEEYIRRGFVVYAGIDYSKVLLEVEREADIILWDGGNNDWPFIEPDYLIAVTDAMRPNQLDNSFPGEVNVRMADLVIINKADRASKGVVEEMKRRIRRINPRAKVSVAVSEVYVDKPELIKGRRVAVLEDAPTVTHGGAPYGAGMVAAMKYGASEIIDPRPYAKGVIKEVYETYRHIDKVIPTMGYTNEQLRDLEETLNSIPCDVIVSGSPIDVARVLRVNKPVVRARYEIKIVEGPSIEDAVDEFLNRVKWKVSPS